jgi:hypothetical protein
VDALGAGYGRRLDLSPSSTAMPSATSTTATTAAVRLPPPRGANPGRGGRVERTGAACPTPGSRSGHAAGWR